MIYNLTTHVSHHENVETKPRLHVFEDIFNHEKVITYLKKVAHEIPRDAEVLIGGHMQFIGILLQISKVKNWKVYFYSSYDKKVYPCTFMTRQDRYEVETDGIL